ncbi:MAG: hypothetical protein ACFFDQ_13620, partial [Candidatus Thorarchaeota archaeon]
IGAHAETGDAGNQFVMGGDDGEVDQDDLCVLLSVWHKSKQKLRHTSEDKIKPYLKILYSTEHDW